MNPDLQSLLDQLESIKREGDTVCAGLTDEQFNWRPGPGRWSVAECLVHLNISATATLPAFDRAIAAGRDKGTAGRAAGPFHYGWFARWMVRSMEPPVKRRLRTVSIFAVPAGGYYEVAQVLPEFQAIRDALAERIRQADGLDLRGLKVISPASRLFRMPLGAYFQFVIAHDRRHLWQARQVRAVS
ncbi:MAG: DinB family protein [Gemmatimonadales bacterium]